MGKQPCAKCATGTQALMAAASPFHTCPDHACVHHVPIAGANTPTPDSVALPPLPNACYAGVFTPEQMYAYAREAIASLPTPGVPVERVRAAAEGFRKLAGAASQHPYGRGLRAGYLTAAEELDVLLLAQEGTSNG